MAKKIFSVVSLMLLLMTLCASSFAFSEDNLLSDLSVDDCRQVGFEDSDLSGMVSNPLPSNFVIRVVDFEFIFLGETIRIPMCSYNYDAIETYFRDFGIADNVDYKIRLTSIEQNNVNVLKAGKDNNRAIDRAYNDYNYLTQIAHLDGSVTAINNFDNELKARKSAGEQVGLSLVDILMIIAGVLLVGYGGFNITQYSRKKKKGRQSVTVVSFITENLVSILLVFLGLALLGFGVF